MKLENKKLEEYQSICDEVCETYQKLESKKWVPEGFELAMKEFRDKSVELRNGIEKVNSDSKLKENIIEVEQAADTVMKIAKGHQEVPEDFQSQVIKVHDKVHHFKKSVLTIE